MMSVVTRSGQPRMTESTMAGADSASPAAEPALDQEDDAHQRARLRVEALLQILVSRVDFRAMEDRHGGGGEDHHGDGQSEIELDEAHAVDVGLPGGGDEGDGAGLGGHDGKTHGVPGHGVSGQQYLIVVVLPRPRQMPKLTMNVSHANITTQSKGSCRVNHETWGRRSVYVVCLFECPGNGRRQNPIVCPTGRRSSVAQTHRQNHETACSKSQKHRMTKASQHSTAA